MKWFFTLPLCMFFLFSTGISLHAQKIDQATNPWKEANEVELLLKNLERRIVPTKYRTIQLEVPAMQTILDSAPLRFNEEKDAKAVFLDLPMPDGTMQRFQIWNFPIMHPDLAAKFPMINSYVGQGIDDPTAYLRFDLTQHGFHAMILTGRGSDIFIDPYGAGDIENYISYRKKDFTKNDPFTCWVEDTDDPGKAAEDFDIKSLGSNDLRTYRLALACTGEYGQYHGGSTASVAAAMNTTMTRVNGVYERDMAVTMQLVPNNDLLIFLNANSDPYTNNNGSTMLGQNISTCNSVIGSSNYDIGHVFSTGGGGVAYLNAVCGSSKAGGVTGQSAPVGDPFDIDYVCHEMGHQYGGRHTQNNNCNRDSNSSYEPGSASTIMGYAGICNPNVQNNSDDYFHVNSLVLMSNFTTGGANGCAQKTTTGNNAPTAVAGNSYSIPRSTPFILDGSASSDPNGDALTYCWEQYDRQVAPMPPQAGNTTGPAFRSLDPTADPERWLPNKAAVIAGSSPTWEVLSNVTRTYNFRLTVRDNFAGAGLIDWDNMTVSVTSTSGPFVVTAPNTALNWQAGSSQTVTWNVAGTTAAPVSAANVDIFLSTDGGQTYPVTLASAVPNDGSQSITVPNNPGTNNRVMVRGSGNIFFDISNTNFTISGGGGSTLTVSTSSTDVSCNGDSNGTATATPSGGSGSYTYNWSNGGTTATINGLTAGTYNVTVMDGTNTVTGSATVNEPPVLNLSIAGTDATSGNNGAADLTVSGGTPGYSYLWSNGATTQDISGLAPGTYSVSVTDANNCTAMASVTILDASGGCIAFVPTNTTVNGTDVTIDWNPVPNALFYRMRYRPTGTSGWTGANTTNTSITLSGLQGNTTYEYQTRTRCDGQNSPWSVTLYTFTTGTGGGGGVVCGSWTPVNIGTTTGTATINWNAESGASAYGIQYRAVSGGPWIRLQILNTTVTLTGLLPGTAYEFQTKTQCPNGWTPWSSSFNFTTDVLAFGQPNVDPSLQQADWKEALAPEIAFQLQPNPAQDYLEVQLLNGQAQQIFLRNYSGQILQTLTPFDSVTTLDLNHLPNGIYFITISGEKTGPVTQRFVKTQ